MRLRKVFRFRLKPTAVQREALARMAGARRFVWNWALAQRNAHYRATGKGLPRGGAFAPADGVEATTRNRMAS